MYLATKSVSREDGQLAVLVTKGEGHNGHMAPVPKELTLPSEPLSEQPTEKERKNERAESPKGISLLGNL